MRERFNVGASLCGSVLIRERFNMGAFLFVSVLMQELLMRAEMHEHQNEGVPKCGSGKMHKRYYVLLPPLFRSVV